MTPSLQLRETVAAFLDTAQENVSNLRAFIGLDGFVDEIFHVVDKRFDAERFDRVPTIRAYADRLGAAAGHSTNVELVRVLTKLGGNGPIMANALASFGLQVEYLGALGYPNLHPVFVDFSQRARVHSIAEPGLTDALEFDDGKLIIGKHYSLKEVTWRSICDRFGRDAFQASLEQAQFVGFVNWTMLPYMSDIWDSIQAEILPAIKDSSVNGPSNPRRTLFFDLADPEKRTREDLRRALHQIVRFGDNFEVILGLNEKEAYEVAETLGLDPTPRGPEELMRLGEAIHREVPVQTLVIHPVRYALTISQGESVAVAGPVCTQPRITTGAGDHFNSGFCLGKLLGLDNSSSLLCGVTTSGHYVRNANSPSLDDLSRLMRSWPQA